MPQKSGLTVRRHERRAVEFDVDFAVVPEHCRQVRFSAASSAATPTTIKGKVHDLSPGGMGLVFRQFVPRMCEGVVRVYGRRRVDALGDGTPDNDVVFEHRVKVRRVIMANHEPEYDLGVSFVAPEPDLSDRVRALLAAMGGEPVADQGPDARGGADA